MPGPNSSRKKSSRIAKKSSNGSKESESQKSSAASARSPPLVLSSSAPSNKRKAADLDTSIASSQAGLVIPPDQIAAFQKFLKQQGSKTQSKEGQKASEKTRKAAEDKVGVF